ncbi:MAG TPA: SDR family oxidoreductase, partial [Candidatus Binatia bacterium]
MNFKDQVALVTGASSGIGQRLAIDLAARGAIVIGCGRSLERLEETAKELKRYNSSSKVVVCDVGDSKQVRQMVEEVLAQFGKIDILVNNAGFGSHQSFADAPVDSIESMLRTNYLGTVYCTKEVLPSMLARRSGTIVNISSVAGKIGTPNMSAYCATKFALIGLSESLYHELRPHGIHVSVICPGPVRTKFH